MDRREQTRIVRGAAEAAERNLAALANLTEAALTTAHMDEVAEAAERKVEAIRQSARNAVELATGGTPTCKRHADRAVAARNAAVDLAATVRRAVETERLRRVEAAHSGRTMLERDYPALAAVVAVDPDDHAWLRRAVALVTADDYREVMDAMWRFRPSLGWDEVAMPSPDTLAEFITEDTDARELAGVILAYASAAEPILPGILAECEAAGWLMPEEAFPDESAADSLVNGYAHPVHGGDDDDHAVAEAAMLAVARYGIFDDDHRPDDHAEPWEAWIVPGVPVWVPHVEAWRRDMPAHDETLALRQMDRAYGDWERWGQDDYLCAYAEAYAEAILDAETPSTVGEDEDSGIHPEDRAEEARERAQTIVDELDVGLSDVRLEESPLDPDEIAEVAGRDARDDYRLAAAREAGPENVIPLF